MIFTPSKILVLLGWRIKTTEVGGTHRRDAKCTPNSIWKTLIKNFIGEIYTDMAD